MKVKKYVVDSLPQAMNEIKKDLGTDAVIIQTKKIKIGGFLKLFRKEKIEVIAAVDEKRIEPVKQQINTQYSDSNFISNKSAASYSGYNYASNNTARYNNDSYSRVQDNKQIKPTNNINKRGNLIESEASESLKSEVSELKGLILKMVMNQKDESNQSNYSRRIKAVFDILIEQGVKEGIATKIIEKVIEQAGNNIEDTDIVQAVKKHIINTFKEKDDNRYGIDNDTKIVHFVGPTGVGKTTTIAKLAAEKVLKHNKKIAFITADTYRIGAVDQLRIYAEIFNSPVEVVFSPQDTQKAIEKLKNYELIFMDTAGRNYKDDMYISELINFLSKNIKSETYLVLSLTHKYEDLISILDQFKRVKIDKLLFTKIDETLTYGSIINIIFSYSYSFSYITFGQNVPDDIEKFNIEKIVDALFGGEKI